MSNNTNDAYLDQLSQMGEAFEIPRQGEPPIGDLDEPAPGHWARVVTVQEASKERWACKIMRFRHRTNPGVYEMFVSEQKALSRFAGSAAPRFKSCGYIRPPEPGKRFIPPEDFCFCNELYSLNELPQVLGSLPLEEDRSWLPFIVMEYLPFEWSLLYRAQQLTDYESNSSESQVIPLWEFLELAIKALDVLIDCQKQGFYYYDHKLEHTIWHARQLRFIDWNGGEWIDLTAKNGIEQLGLAHKTFRHLTGRVLYPLLLGCTLKGHRINQTNGNASLEQINFKEDGVTPLAVNPVVSQLIDPELLAILNKALVDNPENSYSTTEDYREALKQYLKKLSDSRQYDRLYEIIEKIREFESYLAHLDEDFENIATLTAEEDPLYREVLRLWRVMVKSAKTYPKIIRPY